MIHTYMKEEIKIMLKKIGEPVSDFYTTKAMTRYYDKELLQLVLEVHNNALKMVEDEAVPIVDVPYMSDGKPEYWKGRNEVIESVINNIQKLKI